MSMTTREKKNLRQIAHHLDAVVTVAEQGVSEGVREETNRALRDHELIKVKLALTEREERKVAASQLATQCEAQIVHSIGKVVVLYRKNPKSDPKLSNISRYS